VFRVEVTPVIGEAAGENLGAVSPLMRETQIALSRQGDCLQVDRGVSQQAAGYELILAADGAVAIAKEAHR
jgi:hypothetical protein